MTEPTLDELAKDYEVAGHFLRRKDASPSKPSPLFTADAILRLAIKERERDSNTRNQ